MSSTFCEPVKANPSKNSIDADEEVWDIPDSAPMPVEQRPIPNLPQTIAPSYPYRPLALFANGRHVPPLPINQSTTTDKRGSDRPTDLQVVISQLALLSPCSSALHTMDGPTKPLNLKTQEVVATRDGR